MVGMAANDIVPTVSGALLDSEIYVAACAIISADPARHVASAERELSHAFEFYLRVRGCGRISNRRCSVPNPAHSSNWSGKGQAMIKAVLTLASTLAWAQSTRFQLSADTVYGGRTS